MNQILSKTLGGLNSKYYYRQFIFGLIFPTLLYIMYSQEKINFAPPSLIIIFAIVNTLLYPYSRFVYEKIMGFIFAENVFFVNVIFLLVAKFITMGLCWYFAIFISPIGLVYLFFYHTKNEINKQRKSDE